MTRNSWSKATSTSWRFARSRRYLRRKGVSARRTQKTTSAQLNAPQLVLRVQVADDAARLPRELAHVIRVQLGLRLRHRRQAPQHLALLAADHVPLDARLDLDAPAHSFAVPGPHSRALASRPRGAIRDAGTRSNVSSTSDMANGDASRLLNFSHRSTAWRARPAMRSHSVGLRLI